MENELLKITAETKYDDVRIELAKASKTIVVDDVTIIKTPEGKYLAVYPGFGPSCVVECATEKEAAQILVTKLETAKSK